MDFAVTLPHEPFYRVVQSPQRFLQFRVELVFDAIVGPAIEHSSNQGPLVAVLVMVLK